MDGRTDKFTKGRKDLQKDGRTDTRTDTRTELLPELLVGAKNGKLPGGGVAMGSCHYFISKKKVNFCQNFYINKSKKPQKVILGGEF